MVYCQSCGKAVPDGSKLCTFCGAPVPVIDPGQPNVAKDPGNKPVDVSTTEVKRKTINEFYKDIGFWGAIITLAGFFLPFFAQSDLSLFDSVQASASSDPEVLMWVIFPLTAVVILLHNFVPGWPRIITTIFIFLVIITLALFTYVIVKEPQKYFGTDDISSILKIAGTGLYATLIGTILMLFHKRHRRVEIHKTKIIDRTA